MVNLTVGDRTVDEAFVSALKLHVYNTVHGNLLQTLLDGQSVVVDDAVTLQVGRFTARKTNNLFVPGSNGALTGSTAEFYGFTSHKVREKLATLEEAGILELTGKGLRDAFTYLWKPALKHWEVCAYMRFRRYTRDDHTLQFELSRAHHAFGPETFTFPEFFDVYRALHEAEYASTRWGERKWKKMRDSHAYLTLVRSRLEALVKRDLVRQGEGKFQVDPRAADSVHHFDLFVAGTAFHPSLAMCQACPLNDLCTAGSTQRLVRAFNRGRGGDAGGP